MNILPNILIVCFALLIDSASTVYSLDIMGQTISSTQFFLYGKRHFTQSGYLRHVKKYYTEPVQSSATIRRGQEGADSVDLQDKVVVVTGANSGLGKQVATYVAAKGAKVYMLCRSKERAEEAKQDIVQSTENSNVHVLLVDVAELEQVRRVAEELSSQESKIHALVCNAGVLLNDRRDSKEGNEMTFASHLLGGTYLLSKLLVPQLKAADEEGRVVIVTSGGMYNFKLPDWKVLTSTSDSVEYDGVNVYAYAKRAQVLLAERWAKEVPEVSFVTAHPGWADTPAVEEAFGDMKKYLNPLREPWQGAEGICWLVGAKRESLESGALYLDRKAQPKHLAGPFFTEGSYTKNTQQEIDDLMENLKKAAGI